MTAKKETTQYAVVNSIPKSNYTEFQIKVWDTKLGKSRVYSDTLYPTRISAKHAADEDPKLTRVDSFREAQGRVTGVSVPPKPGHSGHKTESDTFAESLAVSVAQYVTAA